MLSALITSRTRLLQIVVTVLFALYIVMLPRYTDFAKTWYALLILTGFLYLLANLKLLGQTSARERTWFAIIVAQFAWIAFTYYYNQDPGWSSSFLWGRHFYLLFLIPMFILLREIRISDRLIIIFLTCSAAVSLADMAIDIFKGVDHRQQGMNPNGFGPIQLCITGVLLFYVLKIPQPTLRRIAFAGFTIALANTVLSWSKSTLIAMILVGALFLLYFTRDQPAWKKIVAALTLVILTSAVYSVPDIKAKFDIAIANVTTYFEIDDYRDDRRLGSFGTRMELWKTAWYIFRENPVTGVGVGGFNRMAKLHSERYQVNDVVHRFSYAHNQYLAALATRGIPGLILFLLFIFYPIYIAMSQRPANPGAEVARLAVIFFCLVYIVGCLGEDHFESKSATLFLSVFLALMLARLSPARQPQPGPS